MKTSSLRDNIIILAATVGSLACLNILAIDTFFRIDLTAEKSFTLSDASVQAMRELEDPVTITAYFSSGLPQQFDANRQYLEDLLEEYRASSNGMFSYEFIDPGAEETAEDRETKKEVKRDILGNPVRDKTSVEKKLETLGVQAVQMQVIEEDERRTKRGYMGVVVRYQEETEVIPVVQDTVSIEYDLTTRIRRLTRIKVPVLGVLQGHGEVSVAEDMARLLPLLEQNYEVRPLELKDGAEAKIDDDVDALMIIGTKEPYSEAQKKAIDQLILQGKSAAFFLDLMEVDLQSFNPKPVDHGFGDLLAAYGAELGQDFVADVQSETLRIQERRGFMLVTMPVRYPFIPLLKVLDPESIITRGITDVPLAFAAPLFLKEDLEGVKVTSLGRSSEKSWLETAEASKLDPRREWGAEEIVTTGPYHLLATLEGKLKSAYGVEGAADQDSHVFIAGSSSLGRDQFLGPSTAGLLLNVVDWMLLDPALMKMRNRNMAEPPIDPELTPEKKGAVKWSLQAIPLALLALLGLAIRFKRNARRRSLAS